jgi:hypothetical protein
VELAGKRVYKLDRPVELTGAGEIASVAASGCNPSNYGQCTLKNAGSGNCISTLGGTGNGTKIYLYGCNVNTPNQLRTIYASDANFDYFEYASVNSPGECLNNTGGRQTNGNQQQLWTCGATNEVYKVVGNPGTGQGLWLGAEDQSNYCLSDDGNTANDAPLVIEAGNYSSNQVFGFG